ncbi:hypothetical protein HPP92_025861 [Vanilla planifolia]|nr:hypothetical protein HPP92_025861 [Vanilla planifolia]
MQSGYGGVSEMQHFVVDGSAHTLFSISPAAPQPNPGGGGGGQGMNHPLAGQTHKFISPFHLHHLHHQTQAPQPPAAPPHFSHFHSIPITQQLFTPPPHHHHHHHQFQLFQSNPQNDHRRLLSTPAALNLDPGQETPGNGATPSFLGGSMNFKLAVDDSSSGAGNKGLNNNSDLSGGILDADGMPESRTRTWHREEDCSAIKEPNWRPLDLDYINLNNKRCKDKEPAEPHSHPHFAKRSRDAGEHEHSPAAVVASNYKLFSELEAIYKPGGSSSTATEGANTTTATPTQAAIQTTGSGSALTGDDQPLLPVAVASALEPDSRIDDDDSTGGEAHTQANLRKTQHESHRRRRRRRLQMGSIAAFFEGLVKQLMEHQEALHQKFLEAMERRDRERAGLEEAWRDQEAARARRDADSRAHDRALAAAREAAILSFLEKITGETLHLPDHLPTSGDTADPKQDGVQGAGAAATALTTTSRWPKAEVQALIRVRSGLETRFQEPGLKGPLWEEVSTAMAVMGYHRSSKRCKEKWENINKYFRKTKDNGRKRSQQSKTCPYFYQLDQLYSKPPAGEGWKHNSELLDAVVVAEREEVGESEDHTEAEEDKPAA